MSHELVVKTDINLILDNVPNCDSENREIILASEKDKIKDIEKKSVVIEVKHILERTIFESGHKFEEKDLTGILLIVCDDLLKDFSHLTIDEIKIAFRKGVRKIYGEYYGITVISIYGWILKYNTETRVEAMKIKREANAIEFEKKLTKPKPTREEWQDMMYKSSLELFEKYKTDKETALDVGNIHYSFLLGLGLIEFTDERKATIKKQAERKIKEDKIMERGKMDSISFIIRNKNMEDNSKLLEVTEKRISMFEYFDDLVVGNIELKALLDQKMKIE